MTEVTDILRYISPNTSFVVNLDDYKRFIEVAKIEEQERIIKLLEQDADNNYYALQLIKGEQN